MTRKALILVDMDGVLADFDGRALEVCAENGIELDIDHISEATFRYLTDHVPDKGQRNKLRRIIDTTPYFADLPVIDGAVDGMRELMSRAEVWVCSKPLDANETCASDKVSWIKRHFPKCHGKLILAPDKSLVQGDVLLDDAPKLKWLDRAVWKPIVYSQPFNTVPDSELFDLPHFQWGDSIDTILNLAKENSNAKN